ncbi:MAG: hypothetical protein FD170_2273 [Bacteroidetes bacterium]|nr:MAG: hypothetical protein FD170_2273 [Bacteroidota bacterium]
MKSLFIIIISSIIITSGWAQGALKKKTRFLDGYAVNIEEYNKEGKLIFSKTESDFSDLENNYNPFIEAFIYDSCNKLEYKVFAHSKFGYTVTIPKYDEQLKPIKEYVIESGNYDGKKYNESQFRFLSAIDNFNDTWNHPMTQKTINKGKPYLNSIKKYNENGITDEIEFFKNGDTLNKIEYSNTECYEKTVYRRSNLKIEHIKKYDIYKRLIAEIRVDSNSHYAIVGQDTSENIIIKYNQEGFITERINSKVIVKDENTWSKHVYIYNNLNQLAEENLFNFDNAPLLIKKYEYENSIVTVEKEKYITYIAGAAREKNYTFNFKYEYYP